MISPRLRCLAKRVRPMRILMISDVYFPRINGVSTSIQTFKQELEKIGHQVTLLVPGYPQPCDDDPTVIRIPSRGLVLDPEDRMMKYRQVLARLPQLSELEFDLLHIHTPFVAHYAGIKLARALHIPAVVTYHTVFEEYLYHYIPFLPRAFLRGFARNVSRRQCNQVDGVIAPSTLIVDLLTGYGIEAAMEVIPTGISSRQFENGDGERFRRKHGIDPQRRLLLNVSRVAFEKNIGLLLEVLDQVRRQLPDVLLVIAGEGPAKQTYMKKATRMGLDSHLKFVGYLDRATELVDCYKSADLFVFASRTETQGLVLLEAMAAGTPVVSVAALGTRDVLDGCGGASITDGSVADFSARILALLEAPQTLAQMRRQAVDYVTRWDSATLAARMADYYDYVLDNPPLYHPVSEQST